MRLTMHEIAELAQVAKSAVSAALNGWSAVEYSAYTSEEIFAATGWLLKEQPEMGALSGPAGGEFILDAIGERRRRRPDPSGFGAGEDLRARRAPRQPRLGVKKARIRPAGG